jgi:hypothetical protein
MKQGIIIAFTTLLLLGACRRAGNGNEENVGQKNTAKTETRKLNIIKKHISIPFDFSFIINLGSVDIIYTQGNYSIEAEGDSAMLTYLVTEFDSNVLTVNVQTDNNKDLNKFGAISNIKLYVSTPELKCVSICGNGGFESQATWRAEDIQIGVLSTGSLKLGSVECTTLDLQSTDIGNIDISDLQAEDATIYSRSSATINANVNVKNLIVVNEGKQKMKLTGKAQKAVFKNPNDINLVNELN